MRASTVLFAVLVAPFTLTPGSHAAPSSSLAPRATAAAPDAADRAVAGTAVATAQPASASASAPMSESGFTPLFDGKTLDGWTLVGGHGAGYIVQDGAIVCPKGGGGNLFTKAEYGDFVLRFEFRMPPEGSNNGLGIRAPLEGDAAYQGIELQIIDEKAALGGKWGTLRDVQYHGSVYDVMPAKKGAMKPAGTWNQQEVIAKGRHITVILNGIVILDANLDTVTDPAVLAKHPGLTRTRGHIGFLGHNDYIEFRNIRIKAE